VLMVHEKKRWKSTALVDILCIWHHLAHLPKKPSLCATYCGCTKNFCLRDIIWRILFGSYNLAGSVWSLSVNM